MVTFTIFVFIDFNMYCFVGQHWAISEIYILNTDFKKYKYKNENTEIYTVYRKSAKKYQDMKFCPYCPALHTASLLF